MYHCADVVAELCVTPDVPIALVQLSSTTDASLLVVSYSQLYAVSKWNVSSGELCHLLVV